MSNKQEKWSSKIDNPVVFPTFEQAHNKLNPLAGEYEQITDTNEFTFGIEQHGFETTLCEPMFTNDDIRRRIQSNLDLSVHSMD